MKLFWWTPPGPFVPMQLFSVNEGISYGQQSFDMTNDPQRWLEEGYQEISYNTAIALYLVS